MKTRYFMFTGDNTQLFKLCGRTVYYLSRDGNIWIDSSATSARELLRWGTFEVSEADIMLHLL